MSVGVGRTGCCTSVLYRTGSSVNGQCAAALALIRDLGDTFVHELWLDHDLGGDDTIRPVSAHLEEIAYFGKPMHVGVIYIHSANAGAAEAVLKGLICYGYTARRTGTDQLISASVTD